LLSVCVYSTVQALSVLTPGSVICEYVYRPEDVVTSGNNSTPAAADGTTADSRRCVFRVVCHKGFSRTINVMCSKVDVQSLKHQLEALGVYRPKISAPKPGGTAATATAADDGEVVCTGGDEAAANGPAEPECVATSSSGAEAMATDE
jgi:hypothetical protein